MRWLTTVQAALLANVQPATIRDWHRRGILPRTGHPRAPWALHDVHAAHDTPKPRRVLDTQRGTTQSEPRSPAL